MLAKIMIVFVTAAALAAGPTDDAFAFSGDVFARGYAPGHP